MPIPNFQELMRPMLVILTQEDEVSFKGLVSKLETQFEITDEERRQLTPAGNTPLFYNRVTWAATYLRNHGLLESPKRGQNRITPTGQKALVDHPEFIGKKDLKAYLPEVDEEQAEAKTPATVTDADINEDSPSTPEEQLQKAHGEIKNALAIELLEQIKRQDPTFMEKLVVELMLAMGYGGWSSEAGQVTQKSNDEGVDGIINEDPLGLDTIYLQAKRYSDNVIGRPDVQSFVGALESKRANKGVFITTSRFSREAIEYVSRIGKSVILINGEQLAGLMIRYNLGVTVKDTYQVKSLDTDYFAEQ